MVIFCAVASSFSDGTFGGGGGGGEPSRYHSTQFPGRFGPTGGKPGIFLRFGQEQKEPDQFVIFSPLDQRGRPMGGVVYSSEFSVFSYSKNKNFTLIGDCADTNRPIQVELNGHVVKDVTGNAFFGQVDLHNVEEDFPKVTVKATAPIDIAHLTVSYFPVAPGKRGVDVVYGPGFHGLEENAAAGLMWNWSRAESDVIFVSYANHPISASIQFSLSVLTARVIHIQINDTEESISFEAAGGKPVHLTGLILQPGENKMHLSSDRPAQPPGNGDPRLIAFGVQNLEVNEEK